MLLPVDRALQTITPAALSFRDGALYSETYGDVYASAAGSLAQSRHVFIEGNDLPARFRDCALFTVVETGFGAGLNFLSTWQVFREHAPAHARLHFVSVEKHPFRPGDLQHILDLHPSLASLSLDLLSSYPPLVPGSHSLSFDQGRVNLLLLFGDAREQLSELDARADAFFLDGFAPAKNPDMWSAALCGELARLAAPGASLATYSVAGRVRESLAQAGFVPEKRVGFGPKREMLCGRYAGNWARPAPASRRIVVVGAGIAGSHCALALARAGHRVEVLEAADSPASGASANPAGLVRPFLSLDRGARSHFSLAAYLHAVRHYEKLNATAAGVWHRCGVLQLARDASHADKLSRALALLGLPEEIARRVDAQEGSRLCGATVTDPGVWFPSAGYLAGSMACRAALQAGGDRVQLRCDVRVAGIERIARTWHLLDAQGRATSTADDVVLANGYGAATLMKTALDLRPVRGQVSMLRAQGAGPVAAVCQEGYVTPAIDGLHIVGSTYDEGDDDLQHRNEDNQANIARAQRMLPMTFTQPDLCASRTWSGVRCVTRDRRPLLGPLDEGLHLNLALGSRGFTWSPLAAELLASSISGAPLPLPRNVLRALSPHRFVKS